jgi:hypothetical protein
MPPRYAWARPRIVPRSSYSGSWRSDARGTPFVLRLARRSREAIGQSRTEGLERALKITHATILCTTLCSLATAAPFAADAATEQATQKHRLGEESEDRFHHQRLSDDRTNTRRKRRQIRAELELHRAPGNDAGREVDREDPPPEPSSRPRLRITRRSCAEMEVGDKGREPHREDRKQIVEHRGERELNPIGEDVSTGVRPSSQVALCASRGSRILVHRTTTSAYGIAGARFHGEPLKSAAFTLSTMNSGEPTSRSYPRRNAWQTPRG